MKIHIETYGCQMNFAESDSLARILRENRYSVTDDPVQADLIILNTCSVRLTAEDRVIGRIGYYRGLAQQHNRQFPLILMGCMAQNIGEEVRRRFPDVVKLVWGTYNKQGVLRYLNGLSQADFLETEGFEFMPAEPQKQTPFKAYLSISHGCDNFCSYCIVPHVRGRERHRSSSEILANARRLVDDGVKEITLLGQNVNSYQDGELRFPGLLRQLAELDGLRRLSFLTSHPKDFSERLAEVMAEHDSVLNYLHLPAQSGNDRVLHRMNRKYTRSDYLKKIEFARQIPGIVLSTDIMVGFPGETEAEFEETLDLMREVRYHDAFMYRYNTRPGTSAAEMKDQVPEAEKLNRLNRLIHTQNSISRNLLNEHIGESHSVLLEAVSKKNKNQLTGRTENGLMVFVNATADEISEIVSVRLETVSGNGFQAKRIEA